MYRCERAVYLMLDVAVMQHSVTVLYPAPHGSTCAGLSAVNAAPTTVVCYGHANTPAWAHRCVAVQLLLLHAAALVSLNFTPSVKAHARTHCANSPHCMLGLILFESRKKCSRSNAHQLT
jgi:hypothetical protein